MTTANRFSAALVVPPGVEPILLGDWCPWCETTHAHGLAGMSSGEGGGKRAEVLP